MQTKPYPLPLAKTNLHYIIVGLSNLKGKKKGGGDKNVNTNNNMAIILNVANIM